MSNTDKIITEEEAHQNPLLATTLDAESDSELKQFLVNYTGAKLSPEQDEVTVHMIAETLAVEFPEFMYAIAEENFLRGYQLGLEDATTLTTETETAPGNEQ